MSKINIVKHPLVEHSLTMLRDKNTSVEEFRKHAAIVSKILFLEATRSLALKDKNIETPLMSFIGKELIDKVLFSKDFFLCI